MEAHPDSALCILRTVPEPETLQGKNQADYALLMTQALDKNYMPLESDSLIQLAIRFYENSDDKVSKGKAYFYYGRFLFEAKRHGEALDIFLKSQTFLNNSKQYKLLGLLSEYIGGINFERDWYDDAILNYKESIRYYILAKDTLSMTFGMRNLGRTYLFVNELDSVYMYYNDALQIASAKKIRSEQSILQELSVIFRLTGDYEKAEHYVLKSLENDNVYEKYPHYLSLGKLYVAVSKFDLAEKYLNLSLESSKAETLSGTYDALSNLERSRGRYELAFNYIEKRDSLNHIVERVEKRDIIAELQKKYENEQLKNENLQIRADKNSIILLGVIILLIIIIIGVYYYYQYLIHKRHLKHIEHTITLNNSEIERYKTELFEYSDVKEGHQNEIGELKGKIALLANQNKDLTERLIIEGHEKNISQESEADQYIIAFRTLLSIKSGTFNRRLSDHDVSLQIALFNFLYNDYATRLMSEFPDMTRHEIELCCLLKLGFTNRELCYAFNTAMDSVRKSKTRLKTRLNISSDDSLDDFLANY